MKTLKSFTIIELVIVMLLAAILSILIGGALINLSQYRQLLDRRSRPIKDLGRLHYLLERDNFNASDVSFSDDSLVFYRDSIRIAYLLLPMGTVRMQGSVVDTFNYLMTRESQLVDPSSSAELLFIQLTSLDTLAYQGERPSITVTLPRWLSSTQQYNTASDEY